MYTLILLADQTRWKDLGSGFRGEQARLGTIDVVTGVLLVLGTGLVIWFLTRALAQQDRRRAYSSPQRLFKDLCAAHDLGRVEQRLLSQIARTFALALPAQIFLEPQRFDGDSLGPAFKERLSEVSALREKLFAPEAVGGQTGQTSH